MKEKEEFMTKLAWRVMNKHKIHSADKTPLVVHRDLQVLKVFHNSLSRDKVSEIFSKSLKKCLEGKVVQKGVEVFKQKDRIF